MVGESVDLDLGDARHLMYSLFRGCVSFVTVIQTFSSGAPDRPGKRIPRKHEGKYAEEFARESAGREAEVISTWLCGENSQWEERP